MSSWLKMRRKMKMTKKGCYISYTGACGIFIGVHACTSQLTYTRNVISPIQGILYLLYKEYYMSYIYTDIHMVYAISPIQGMLCLLYKECNISPIYTRYMLYLLYKELIMLYLLTQTMWFALIRCVVVYRRPQVLPWIHLLTKIGRFPQISTKTV
jgi:hypothetical protein